MSRFYVGYAVAVALVFCGTSIADIATQECLQQGDAVGVFYVTKVAGAEDDGVEPGEDLCYRCRYGSSPMIMVFVRDTGGNVVDLLKQIDAAVAAHEDCRLKGLLTLIGEDASKLKEEASKLALSAAVKHVPVVIAKETKTGPLNYKLPGESAVSIVVAKDSQVVNTHFFSVGTIDVAAVMKEVRQILN